MQTSPDTEPRNPLKGQNLNQYNANPSQTGMVYAKPEDDEPGGPGCIIWGIVGMFSVLLAGVLVIVSAVAGWNSGVSIARSNATATLQAEVQIQCDQMQTDVDNGNTGLLERRIEFIMEQTPAPDCLVEYIPTATQLYINSLPTETPTPTETATSTITPTLEATLTEEPTVETVLATNEPSTSGGLFDFDLDGLLAEAQAQLAESNYQDAIDTLDAIIAIDETYQRSNIESLYFNALTSEATLLFRSGKLSEGIVITGRAEAYGDIQGLNYERFIAQLYLDAQRLKITNPGESVRLFSRVAYEQGLANYLNGQVMTELQEAYANYGDTLAEQGDACAARDQYNNALNLSTVSSNISRAEVTSARDSASAACSGAVPAGQPTAEPITNPDGTVVTATPFPTSPPQPTIVPVGQSGG